MPFAINNMPINSSLIFFFLKYNLFILYKSKLFNAQLALGHYYCTVCSLFASSNILMHSSQTGIFHVTRYHCKSILQTRVSY